MIRERLRRNVVLRTKPKRDPVTPQTHAEVIERDLRVAGGCVAPHLDAMAGECRNQWGIPVPPWIRAALTLDHIRPEPAMGMRGPSLPRWLVTLCWSHHLNGWATRNRPLLRKYLAEVER